MKSLNKQRLRVALSVGRKMRITILLILLFCSGCSTLDRRSLSIVQENDHWKRSGGQASYICSNGTEYSLSDISISNLAIVGPLIPLIPIWRDDPQILYLSIRQSETCPNVEVGGLTFEAYKTETYQNNQYCRYKLDSLDLSKPVMLQIKNIDRLCVVPQIKYLPEVEWFYMPITSA